MKIQTEWNLRLLYKNGKDPRIEKDLNAIEKAFVVFEKKYKGKDFTSTSQKLLKALQDSESLEETLQGLRPWWYFALRNDLNSDDKEAGSKATVNNERLTKARNKVSFFSLEIGKIPATKQAQYLKSHIFKSYKYLLKTIFDESKYKLTEKEEQLASLLTHTSYTSWKNGQSKLLSQQTVKFKGKNIPVDEASSMIADLPRKDRQALHGAVNKTLLNISHFAESEINAIYNFKKIMDERRGYKKPYSSTILSYENDEKTIGNLIDLVTKNFTISHRFYKIHAKLLKEKKLTLADRAVSIGKIKKKFNFATATGIVKRAFAKVDFKYVEIFDSFLQNGQIDVYPKKGKKGGAYSWGSQSNPTFILLNHIDNIRWVETLAHEMGHSFHTHMSKSQPLHYQGYSTATAEVASTFFEQIATAELESELSEGEYLILLHNKIKGDISTIFRQIAFFNFENELHQRIRKEGELPKEEIAKLMSKHLRSYLGSSVEVTDEDGYFFVHIGHIRRFFYVYSYAYGQLISRALFEKWKADPSYSKKIEQFLSAGGSMSPKDIFKSIGIDTSDPKFFATGLKAIEKDIEKLEKLSKKV